MAAARADGQVSVRDASSGESAETELSVEGAARPAEGHWSTYPFTVARRVARNFRRPLRGVDLAFASDLPPASGLSSSSALVVGTFLALADANDLASRSEYAAAIRTPEDLAEYLGCIENGEAFRDLAGDRGVGTRGGSQDHTAILCARPCRLAQYAFAPVQFERQVPFPSDHALVVAASGVAAAKTGDAMKAYNRAAQRAAAALHAWRLGTGSRAKTLATALAEAPNAVSRLRELSVLVARFSADSLVDRAEQLRQECEEIIPRAGDSLTAPVADERRDVARESGARDDRAGAQRARAGRRRGFGLWRGIWGQRLRTRARGRGRCIPETLGGALYQGIPRGGRARDLLHDTRGPAGDATTT
ncbi:MAG: hypothetical protein E6H78_16305 [Betaproteobacteria bacterium]|nr:MAG: hypothetical protein E6H78_16305 [Betaproteobacteria bacterium]